MWFLTAVILVNGFVGTRAGLLWSGTTEDSTGCGLKKNKENIQYINKYKTL